MNSLVGRYHGFPTWYISFAPDIYGSKTTSRSGIKRCTTNRNQARLGKGHRFETLSHVVVHRGTYFRDCVSSFLVCGAATVPAAAWNCHRLLCKND